MNIGLIDLVRMIEVQLGPTIDRRVEIQIRKATMLPGSNIEIKHFDGYNRIVHWADGDVESVVDVGWWPLYLSRIDDARKLIPTGFALDLSIWPHLTTARIFETALGHDGLYWRSGKTRGMWDITLPTPARAITAAAIRAIVDTKTYPPTPA